MCGQHSRDGSFSKRDQRDQLTGGRDRVQRLLFESYVFENNKYEQ